jgi:hypothetical protein
MNRPGNVRLIDVAIRWVSGSPSRAIAGRDDEKGMMATGERIDETGTLIQAGEILFLRRDNGGRYQLELHRLPVDLLRQRVRLIGTLVGPMLVHAERVALA